MAKIGLLLLSLILYNNVFAWSCYYDNGEDGWFLEGTMVCTGIETQVAIEDHYCVWHRPDDPYCTQYQEPLCVDTIEYKTESCPPNYSGGRSYSRQYVCQQASWTDWTLSSDNCTPDPPSCIETSVSRTMECPQGYSGTITEQRLALCPDPYGSQQWQEWVQTESTCTQNVSDPVSPISVVSPVNPASPIQIDTAIAPQIDAQETINPVANPTQPNLEESIEESVAEETDSVSKESNQEGQVKQNKKDRDNKQSKNNEDNVVNDTQEIVHGFGLVLSLEILQKPMEFYQPPLVDMFSITQEFPVNESTRKFQLDLLKRDDIEDYYFSISDHTWERIRSSSIY